VRTADTLDHDVRAQAADSHFMIRRITSSLLLAGAGLFQHAAAGRVLFRDVEGHVTWDSHLDIAEVRAPKASAELLDRFYGWIKVLCESVMLRRAADDVHLALRFPDEAAVFVYRGLEWLKAGQKLNWEDLAPDIGVSVSQLREFKKLANVETGVRHASSTGAKLRADMRNVGMWVAALVDAINAARRRLDSTFTPMSPEEVADWILTEADAQAYE
jgi:hypothetical protein